MIPSSVRRVVASAPQTPIFSPHAAFWASSAPKAAASINLRGRPGGHQRRCSSSKPSSPDNGSKDIPSGQSVPASASSQSETTKSGEKRKRKAKASGERNDFQRLPSVPSTQHLSQEALGLATFFSLHRPISITHSLPKTISDENFAEIFAPRTRSNKVSDVISTLSRTVEDIEGPMSKMALRNESESDYASDAVHKIDVKYPDGRESSVYVQVNSMSGQFLPFQPPPLPSALEATNDSENSASAADSEEAVEEAVPHHRTYKAMFTIEETTDDDGQVRVVAHSPRVLMPYTERTRHLRYEEIQRRRETLQAISVKRQRKLKMKKKKYKKFMKRTRNLRRRLDRL